MQEGSDWKWTAHSPQLALEPCCTTASRAQSARSISCHPPCSCTMRTIQAHTLALQQAPRPALLEAQADCFHNNFPGIFISDSTVLQCAHSDCMFGAHGMKDATNLGNNIQACQHAHKDHFVPLRRTHSGKSNCVVADLFASCKLIDILHAKVHPNAAIMACHNESSSSTLKFGMRP